MGWVIACPVDRGKGHLLGQGSGAPGLEDEVRSLRAGLGSTMLTQDESGSILNEIPVSQESPTLIDLFLKTLVWKILGLLK